MAASALVAVFAPHCCCRRRPNPPQPHPHSPKRCTALYHRRRCYPPLKSATLVGEPSNGEAQALDVLDQLLGPGVVSQRTAILFDDNVELDEDESLEEYLSTWRKDVQELVRRCGNRYHILEPHGAAEDAFCELVVKVEELIKEKGGQHFSCPLYQEVEKRLRDKQAEIIKKGRLAISSEDELTKVAEVPEEGERLFEVQPLQESPVKAGVRWDELTPEEQEVVWFTDGSCRYHAGKRCWKAGAFNPRRAQTLEEMGEGKSSQWAELKAVHMVIMQAGPRGVHVYTDSWSVAKDC
ncbi:unnamed protein product [Tetraodon nigroviridis]|uniref:(spotted green pufferfish) hypothetical protein n=1 Tax=Tetraodon nigroviridis TaxID=99883 RepID=Q4RHM2_TETNG|nr:unnamed protein product [Tetraodon nigroviridis]